MAVSRVRSRHRRKILFASLMPGVIIGVPLAMLLVSELQSLGRLEQASRQLLTQTGVRVADELAQAIRRDLTTMHSEVLDAIPRVALRRGDLETLRSFVDTNRDPATLGTLFVGIESASTGAANETPRHTVLFDAPEPFDGSVNPRLVTPTALGGPAVIQLPAALSHEGFRTDPEHARAVLARVEHI